MSIEHGFVRSTKGNLSVSIHTPQENKGKLAILCPGFLDNKDYPHLVDLACGLAERGYTAVRFNPTGTWDSAGEISDYTTTQYLADVEAILSKMWDPKVYSQLLVGGHSFGGLIASLFAGSDRRVATAMAIMSAYTFDRPSNEKKKFQWQQASELVNRRDVPGSDALVEFRVPYAPYVPDRLKYNALDKISDFRGYLVAVAGRLDTIVDPKDVEVMFDRANHPKRFLQIEGVGHDYRKCPDQIKIVNDLIFAALDNRPS